MQKGFRPIKTKSKQGLTRLRQRVRALKAQGASRDERRFAEGVRGIMKEKFGRK